MKSNHNLYWDYMGLIPDSVVMNNSKCSEKWRKITITIRRKEKFIWFLSTFYYWSFLIIPSSAEFKGMTRKHTVNKKLDWFNLIDLFFGISKSKYRNQWMVILSFSHAKINYQFFWRRFTSILYLKNNDQPDWQHQKLLFHYYNVRQK